MNDLIRAELLKFRTTRMLYGLAAGMMGTVALSVAGHILVPGQERNIPLDTAAGVASVWMLWRVLQRLDWVVSGRF